MNNEKSYSQILIALPKPLYAPAGLLWQISGDLIRSGFNNVIEVQFFHVLVPLLFSTEPYLVLVSTELLDLDDTTNSDRATLNRASKSFPQSTFIVWDKKQVWEQTDTPNSANFLVWTDGETDEVTKKILKLLGVHDDGHHDRRRGRS